MRPVLQSSLPPTLPRRRRPRLVVVQVLPTLITLGNVLAGFLAISYAVDAWGRTADVAAREQLWVKAAWMIFVGMVCDALDGRVARLTGAESAFGAELDSLADMITFGVAPALLAKSISQHALPWLPPKVATVLAMVYVLGAALRLARYNVESARVTVPNHVTRVFRGLPSPGAAGVIASIVLLRHEYGLDAVAWGLLVGAPVLGVLMISRFAFTHVMNRYLSGSRSPFVAVFLLLAVFLAVEAPEATLAGVFVLYAVSGPLFFLTGWLFGRPRWAVDEADDEDDDEVFSPEDGAASS